MALRPSAAAASILPLALAAACAAARAPAPPPPGSSSPGLHPPVARVVPHATTLHGEVRQDDYFWLRAKGTPEVESYLAEEQAYALAFTRPTLPLQERLYGELVGRLQQTDASVPALDGGWRYYSRTEAGQQYPVHCRRRDAPGAPEQVLLDLNALAAGKAYLAVGLRAASPDGARLAYTTDETGFRQYTLRLRDLSTGRDGPEAIERVTSAAWAADSRTLLYAVEHPVSKRAYQVWRHVAGQAADVLVLEEPDERFEVEVGRTTDRTYLTITTASLTSGEVRVLPAATPAASPRLVAARQPDHLYDLDHRDGLFYLRTNSGGRNYRVVSAPAADPGRARWQELLPHRDAVMVEGLTVFQDFFLLQEREGGLPHLRVVPFAGGPGHRLEFPEAAYEVEARDNLEFGARVVRFAYQSPTSPEAIYDYDWRTRQRRLLKQVAVPGFDPGRYEVGRGAARAADGVAVPYWTLRLRGASAPGPLLLYGYGAYGMPEAARFSSDLFSLVDRGVTYAVAYPRGGGELGKAWHEGGRMGSKPNTFGDFIAVAEHLVATGQTTPSRLAIEGGSAGGLLVAAAVTLRPDLFGLVIAQVPFVDVINTMLDESLPLTVGEFEEWGNPKVEAEYRVMRRYSPYDNVAARAYPAMLVKTSYNDSQVMYWEPAKWVARLRAQKTDRHALVFHVNLEPAGHGGRSGRFDRLRETAFDQAFLLWQLGVEDVGASPDGP